MDKYPILVGLGSAPTLNLALSTARKEHIAVTDIQIFYDGPIVKRADAKAAGEIYYFTGKVCSKNHLDRRYTKSGDCVNCAIIRASAYNRKNPEKNIESCKKWRMEKLNGKARPSSIAWAKDNSEKIAEYRRNRRAKIASADGTHTKNDIKSILTRQNWKCAEPSCLVSIRSKYHVDHIMPIALGGSNWPSNLQCLCQNCNNRKHAKHPLDWARENGRLV